MILDRDDVRLTLMVLVTNHNRVSLRVVTSEHVMLLLNERLTMRYIISSEEV